MASLWKDFQTLPVPAADADIDTAWTYLQSGLECIMRQTSLTPYPAYMSLYTYSYNVITSHRATGEHFAVRSEAIYHRIRSFYGDVCVAHFQDLQYLEGNVLLETYVTKWNAYKAGVDYINRVFTYLNRHWVKRERDDGRINVYPVNKLALMQWNQMVVQARSQDYTSAVLEVLAVSHDRNGEITVSPEPLKVVLQSLVDLGIDSHDLSKKTYDVYDELFEVPFLYSEEAYFHEQAQTLRVAHAGEAYTDAARNLLEKEIDRIGSYVDAKTKKAVELRGEKVLFQQQQTSE